MIRFPSGMSDDNRRPLLAQLHKARNGLRVGPLSWYVEFPNTQSRPRSFMVTMEDVSVLWACDKNPKAQEDRNVLQAWHAEKRKKEKKGSCSGIATTSAAGAKLIHARQPRSLQGQPAHGRVDSVQTTPEIKRLCLQGDSPIRSRNGALLSAKLGACRSRSMRKQTASMMSLAPYSGPTWPKND